MPRTLFLALALLATPAFAQTTTTVTTEPQPQQQPPPPPPAPSTQVVVNPNDPNAAPPPPPRTRVRVTDDATPTVETVPTGRSAVAIVATDAIYGGVAGAVVGGGVTLIDQGNYWQRDIMVGAGVGVLIGAAYGVYEAAVQPKTVVRAVADRNPAASDAQGTQVAMFGGRF